jgi:hypothetical protein
MLPADDTRLFTVRVREKTPALLLSGGGAFYLAQALAPEGADSDIDLLETEWRSYTTADLSEADVVIAGPGGLPGAGDGPLLRRFAEGGGRVIVFISTGMEGLAASLSTAGIAVSPRSGSGGFLEPERPADGGPLLSGFGPDGLEAFSRLKFVSPPRVTGLPAGTAAVTYSDGSPMLWTERAGSGEIVFAAFDPSPESGDIVLSPWFLPLVQQMALASLTSSPAVEGALVGRTVQVPAGGDCAAVLPDGTEYVDPAADPGGTIAVPAGEIQGFISTTCGGWEAAVNPDCRAESELSAMSAREAADSLGLAAWASAPAAGDVSEAVREAREGREIAEILIIAAALLLAAELAVAQLGRGGEEAAA